MRSARVLPLSQGSAVRSMAASVLAAGSTPAFGDSPERIAPGRGNRQGAWALETARPPHRHPVRNKDHVREAPSNQIRGGAPAVFYNMAVDRHPGPPDLP